MSQPNSSTPTPDLSQYSDEELKQIAGLPADVTGGNVPKTEGFMQKALKNLSNPATRPLTPGLLQFGMSAMGHPEESALPLIGAVGGGMLGTEAMHPEAGAAIGAGLGSAGEELVKSQLRGKKANYANPLINSALTYGGAKVLSGARNVFNTAFPGAADALSNRITTGVSSALKNASNYFGGAMDNLESANPKSVDFISPVIKSMQDKPQYAGELSNAFENLPSVKYITQQGGDLSKLSLPESQDIINEFSDSLRTSAFQKGASPTELPHFDMLDNFKDAQDLVHPDMATKIRPDYEKIMDAKDVVVNNRYPIGDKLLGTPVKESTKADALKTLLGGDLAKQTLDFQSENALTKAIGGGLKGAGVIGAGEWFGNKLKGKPRPTEPNG
jgi:hypothetical protein